MLTYWIYVTERADPARIPGRRDDLRGHGESEPAADRRYALARFGDDLEAMLERALADGERAVIAGHSLGAMSIAAWAEHHDVAQPRPRRRADQHRSSATCSPSSC